MRTGSVPQSLCKANGLSVCAFDHVQGQKWTPRPAAGSHGSHWWICANSLLHLGSREAQLLDTAQSVAEHRVAKGWLTQKRTVDGWLLLVVSPLVCNVGMLFHVHVCLRCILRRKKHSQTACGCLSEKRLCTQPLATSYSSGTLWIWLVLIFSLKDFGVTGRARVSLMQLKGIDHRMNQHHIAPLFSLVGCIQLTTFQGFTD